MTKLLLTMLAASSIVLGCGPRTATPTKPQTFDAHHELVATSGTDAFSYLFAEDGCTTGRHTFDDHAELCRALVDDALNYYCAWEQRRDYYEQKCR